MGRTRPGGGGGGRGHKAVNEPVSLACDDRGADVTTGGVEFPGGLPTQDGVEFEAPEFPSGPQRLNKSLSIPLYPGLPWGHLATT